MATNDFIQIIIKNGDFLTWQDLSTAQYRLAKGEPAAVWDVLRSPDGDILRQADGSPVSGKLLYQVIGDGINNFANLPQLWAVSKAAFNSAAAGRMGTSRSMENLTLTNANLPYNTLEEALTAFFHPYAQPVFTSFAPSSYENLEVGLPHDINGTTFTWTSLNSQNVNPNSVFITETFAGASNVLNLGGAGGTGSYQAIGRPVRFGAEIGQEVSYLLSGANTKLVAMAAVRRTRTWQGKRLLFMHPDSEWLINSMTAKIGGQVGTTNTSDADLAVLLNGKLDTTGILGNGAYGLQALDGGNTGKRAYVLYPIAYRTTTTFIDPSFNQPNAPTVYRPIVLTRNGVSVNYMLMGMDLRVVQVSTLNIT